jgi:AcrR family transcriptional regulator
MECLESVVKRFIVITMKITEMNADPALAARKPRRGRPKAFDRAVALDAAMRLFWLRGYDVTSVAELADAMGINAPSLYATFGDKRQLFEEALARYLEGQGSFARRALENAPSGRAALADMLEEAAQVYVDPAQPPGCMVIHSGQNCAPAQADIAARLAAIRAQSERMIADRILSAREAGEIPADADVASLAAYFAAVLQGLSTHARDGASPDTLRQIARLAMQAWPQPAAIPAGPRLTRL